MRRRLRRAAPLLAAVALTGLVRPAPAQLSVFSGGRAQPVAYRVNEASAGAARLDEMQAELVWMGDESTFPCPLTAHAVGPYLLISGSVPNATVKTRALQLAGQVCKLALKESIRLQPGEPDPPTPPSPATLHDAAAKMLSRTFGARTQSFEILALEHGKLVLHGKIDSYEEKLAVSRYLRQLLGVTSIQNELEVSAFLNQGRAVSRVTRDGKIVVEVAVSVPQTAADPKPVVTQAKPAKTTTTATQTPARVALVPDTQVLPKMPPPPSSTTPTSSKVVVTKGSTTTSAANADGTKTAVALANWRSNGDGSEVTAPTSVSSETPTPRVLSTSQTPEHATTPYSRPRPMGGLLSHLFGWNKPEKETVVYPRSQVSSSGTVATVSAPSSGVTSAAGSAYHAQPAQIATVVDKSGTAKPPGKPALPYESNGVAYFEDDQPVQGHPAKHVAMAAVHADFKQRVAALCGKQARNVEVATGPDKMVILKMTVNSEAVEKVLREKILRLPEMKTATMRLEITISPE